MPTIRFENATGTFTYEEAEQIPPPIDPPPIEPPTTEPPPTGGDVWQPPSYLRTDTRIEATPNTRKPDYLADFKDPTFGTKIVRITGDPGSTMLGSVRWPDVARHHYNSDQAWNCDQTMIYLDEPGVFLDGENYQPLFTSKNIPTDSDVRWSVTDPAVLHFAAGSKLGTWNPKTGEQKTIKDFGSAYSGCKFGPWEGSFSEDGDTVVISCSKSGRNTGFAYSIKADKKYPDIAKDSNNVRISSKGTYIVWGCDPDKVIITDLAGAEIHTLPNNYVSHFDVITDQDGDECLVGRNNGAGGGQSGAMTKYRLRDGKKTQLCSGGWCSHTSTRALKTHRWAVSAPTDEGGNVPPPYRGELIMSNLDGSKTYRLGHTHEPSNYDYKAETQPSHSPDGGRVIFASAWGASGSTPRPVGCYIADFRT